MREKVTCLSHILVIKFMNNNELRKNNREVIDLKTTAYIILEQLYHRANNLEERKYIKWHYNRYIKLLEMIFEHSKKFFNTLQETIKYLDVGIGYGHISIILNKILKWDFFGIDKITGSIEIGKSADLQVVKGNPLENIDFLGDVSMVIIQGNLIDKLKVKKIKNLQKIEPIEI